MDSTGPTPGASAGLQLAAVGADLFAPMAMPARLGEPSPTPRADPLFDVVVGAVLTNTLSPY
ncbi:hypothetical protein [Streptomyces venezuelae]|uniref:hypothetical protein n=1 Tax=Streptomyces venezuelae TaxID=54571 RepID=UPI003658A626